MPSSRLEWLGSAASGLVEFTYKKSNRNMVWHLPLALGNVKMVSIFIEYNTG